MLAYLILILKNCLFDLIWLRSMPPSVVLVALMHYCRALLMEAACTAGALLNGAQARATGPTPSARLRLAAWARRPHGAALALVLAARACWRGGAAGCGRRRRAGDGSSGVGVREKRDREFETGRNRTG
jgi:hypothetical protein